MEFEYLYKKYNKSIYLFILKKTLNREIAEDITAETFFKLYELWDNLVKDHEKQILSWLYTTARNRVVDYYRKENKNTNLNFDPESQEDIYEEIGYKIDMKNQTEKVYKAMQDLSDEKKEVLELRFKHGLKIKEISEIIGKNEGAIKMIIYRSLIEIRQNLNIS